MFRQALSRAEASLLREDLLSAIPPAKRTTRVFANHMCQVRTPSISIDLPRSPSIVLDGLLSARWLRGPAVCRRRTTLFRPRPELRATLSRAAAGTLIATDDPPCMQGLTTALSPVLLQLAAHPHVLRLVRSLLGEGSRLHNAGLSLVTPPPEARGETPGTTPPEARGETPGTTPPEARGETPGTTPVGWLAAHLPHQDQPVNSARVWSGRAPPPTHPLSLQVR